MKMNKQITLDVELVLTLQKLEINVSDFCNQALWTYITKIENKSKEIKEENRDIDEEINKLEKEKENIEKRKNFEEEMKEEGLNEKAIRFLKNMNCSIGAVKNNKESWLRITGKAVTWEELKELKEKWGFDGR